MDNIETDEQLPTECPCMKPIHIYEDGYTRGMCLDCSDARYEVFQTKWEVLQWYNDNEVYKTKEIITDWFPREAVLNNKPRETNVLYSTAIRASNAEELRGIRKAKKAPRTIEGRKFST